MESEGNDIPPVLFDTATERDLFVDFGTYGRCEHDLGEIVFDGEHAAAGRRRADVDHQHLALAEALHLALLARVLDTEQLAQQKEVDLDLVEDVRQLADLAQHLADETVGATQRRVDVGADTDEATGHGVLEVVGLGKERQDAREDGCALDVALAVARHDAGADLDLVANLHHHHQHHNEEEEEEDVSRVHPAQRSAASERTQYVPSRRLARSNLRQYHP